MKKIFLIIILVSLLSPLASFAASYRANGHTVTYEGIVPCGRYLQVGASIRYVPCHFCHLFVMIERIIDFILFNIVFPLSILLLGIGGFLFIFQAENPENVRKGKSILTSVIIGLAIIFTAWTIINLFFQLIGVAAWQGLDLRESWWQINCQITLPPL